MTDDRYVVLGLAHVRSPWFTEVARWATAGTLPVEFVKCLSVEQLRARASSGRPFSAALLDGGLPSVDRDLLATLSDADVPALVVDQAGPSREWVDLGAATGLEAPLSPAVLLDALASHSRMITAVDQAGPEADHTPVATSSLWRGRLVTVLGQPGSGRSTLAAALAQGLAADPRQAGDVVLADLARRAHQAILHDARDVIPGVQELVDAHRSGQPGFEQVRQLTFDVPVRNYRLLLGLRRPRDWVSLRSRAFHAALDGLCRSSRIVVADTDDDLEGEAETGSFDIEDRNLMARTATTQADLVVLTATASITGVHGLVRALDDLRSHGVSGDRTVMVINRAPRSVKARAELTRTVANLAGSADRADPPIGPVYIAERRGIDAVHRDLAPIPKTITEPLTASVREVLDRLPNRGQEVADPEPQPVVPGSLGSWGAEEAGP